MLKSPNKTRICNSLLFETPRKSVSGVIILFRRLKSALLPHAELYSKRIFLLVLFINLIFSARLNAQFHFDSWTTEQGLPYKTVNSVLQTKDGYVWAATSDGLARFDGVKFEWSQGQVEGQVNRLKMLKRQMYGRSKFDLLRARVLHRV